MLHACAPEHERLYIAVRLPLRGCVDIIAFRKFRLCWGIDFHGRIASCILRCCPQSVFLSLY